MTERHFNLVTEPWIRVLDVQNHPQEVSLTELVQNTGHYRQLAGEMPAQDLVILRLLLAILTTVYSRYDAEGVPYEWLTIDPETMRPTEFDESRVESDDAGRDLLDTWKTLFQAGQFSTIVVDYLQRYQDRFDLFDPIAPFYQVTREEYDSLVPANKVVEKGKGTVAVKQMNRTISESGHSRNVFSPRTELTKNQVSPAELTRWLLTYQGFTGVTDKTKVNPGDFSVAKGWIYGLNPVFVKGATLFETLLLNLVLDPKRKDRHVKNVDQRPEWEDNPVDYVHERVHAITPENIAELYTTWSRVIHIERDGDEPTIFSAGMPKLDSQGAFIEPMTTWKEDKKDSSIVTPNRRWLNSLGKAMWRNFGQYVRIEGGSQYEPGVVTWLHYLRKTKQLPRDFSVRLATTGLINDGNASSQLPAAEFNDDFGVKAEVLFDDNQKVKQLWPQRIEDAVVTTNQIGTAVYQLARNVASLGGVSDSGTVGGQVATEFYDRLNEPFRQWLISLSSQDERDVKVAQWEQTAKQIAFAVAHELMGTATPRQIQGKQVNDQEVNIFTYYRIFNGTVAKILRH